MITSPQPPRPLTRALARYAVETRYAALPDAVKQAAARTFLNWLGVAIGGCGEPAVRLAAETELEIAARPVASMLGHSTRTSVAGAAFVNCIASSVNAFDDAHLPSVAHPSGPAAAALLALAQSRTIDGETFLCALALGVELQCRLANALVLPPSTFNGSIYVNGFSGPIGVAAAVGHCLGLDETRMAWALGLAASQASGFRATHGTMTAHFRPGHAARAGLSAALLAARGFDCTDNALEAKGGFFDIFAPGADLRPLTEGLGARHEMLHNRFKPYPCGIVIHPVIDACLEIRAQLSSPKQIESVQLLVNPAVLSLTGKRRPRTPLESHVSVYHWVACALIRGQASLSETEASSLQDRDILELADQTTAVGDTAIGKGAAVVTVRLRSGEVLTSSVTTARGSGERPMTDEELDAKFDALTAGLLPASQIYRLRSTCYDLAKLEDVGRTITPLLPESPSLVTRPAR